jgi:PAS domain S-box-containing protein
MKHRLLAKQLRRLNLSEDVIPTDLAQWREFLKKVDNSYAEADQERYLLERSLRISSEEMQERWLALRDMEEQWRSLGECVPDLILMVDTSGRIHFANRGRDSHDKGQLIGSDLLSLYIPNELASAKSAFDEVILKGNTATMVCNGVHADGSVFRCAQRFSPIVKSGMVVGAVIVETDITEQERLTEEIEIARVRVAHASKLATLGEMAGGIAHEINTPLGAILMLASILSDESTGIAGNPETTANIGREIEQTVGKISKIVKGLRTFARHGDEDPFVRSELVEIVDQAVGLIRERVRLLGIDLALPNEIKECTVECRADQIAQIVMNLLSNAIDAISEEKTRKISVEIEEYGNQVALSIIDSGPTIPPEIREKLMQPFFTTKEPGKGTGLGLSISRAIAEQHGGTLYLDESSEQTRFVLLLPRRQSERISA